MSRKQTASDIRRVNEKPNNLRSEYVALSNYFNSLVSFRLTLLGFYLAAIGFMVSGTWPIPIPVSLLGILLTIALYLFELRTRILFHHLSKRAIEIEQVEWEYREGELPFYSRQFPTYLERYSVNITGSYYTASTKIFGIIPIKGKFITHSFALDLIYIGILLFFMASTAISIVNRSSPPLVMTTPTVTITSTSTETQTATPGVAPTLTPSSTQVFIPTASSTEATRSLNQSNTYP